MGCIKMKQKNLFLMCGTPGSGKTTFIKNRLNAEHDIHISRDEIRFSLLKDGEDYFAHEDEVVQTFINTVKDSLQNDKIDNIYIDATHLTPKARKNVLDNFDLENVSINIIAFEVPLEECLRRNALRTGLARVPETAVRRMHQSYRTPTNNEKYKYDSILIIKE